MRTILAMLCGLAAMSIACGGPSKKRPLGSQCGSSDECESGLCLASQCVDPNGDADLDGLTNGIEASLGSNADAPDSDADGITDPEELGLAQSLVDSDGDGKPDIIESLTADVDDDCITDQLDARDGVADPDPSPMLSQVCRMLGPCAEAAGQLRVTCAGGTATCVYDGIAGFADPEIVCDGRDDNCDGTADESFAGGCPSEPVRAWVAPGVGGVAVAGTRHRATIVYGPGLAGTTSNTTHRVQLGRVAPAP